MSESKKKYCRVSDVTLSEEIETTSFGDAFLPVVHTKSWVATFCGFFWIEAPGEHDLMELSGPRVTFSRSADTADKAMLALETTAHEEGWEFIL